MTPLAVTRRVARLAARQCGNITRTQLREAGLTDWEIRRRIDLGWLVPRHRDVLAVGHVPGSRLSKWWAGVLALGPLAALSHRAAGAFWRTVDGAVPTDVTVPPGTGKEHRDGLVVHRCALPEEHVTAVDGLRVTTLVRTMLDLAAVLDQRPLERALEQAQVLHHLSPDALAVELLVRRGYRGTRKLRRALAGAVDPAAVRSVLELRFLKLCAANGIAAPLVNERFAGWELDFWWPAACVVVETDGYDFHRTAAARRRDAEKDAALRALGFTVLRFSWQDVTARHAAVAESLRDALSASQVRV